jgi:hypothetical protein
MSHAATQLATTIRRRAAMRSLAVAGRLEIPKNREFNRKFSDSTLKIIELCQKSENFVQKQGINREFCGYLAKLFSTTCLVPILYGFKKLTGNYQGIFSQAPSFSAISMRMSREATQLRNRSASRAARTSSVASRFRSLAAY